MLYLETISGSDNWSEDNIELALKLCLVQECDQPHVVLSLQFLRKQIDQALCVSLLFH